MIKMNKVELASSEAGPSLCPESWQMYFCHASAYMDAASILAMAELHEDARRLLELARKAHLVCRENFASRQ